MRSSAFARRSRWQGTTVFLRGEAAVDLQAGAGNVTGFGARQVGDQTPAAVSKNVARLEADLGVRLFQRSTRSLALTEAGERFLREVAGGLATIQCAIANLASAEGQPAGTPKVSMALAFGRDYLMPLLGDFVARYPAIVPDWHFDNHRTGKPTQVRSRFIKPATGCCPRRRARSLTSWWRNLLILRGRWRRLAECVRVE